MAHRPSIKISKLDAAKRQIETAIQLWLYFGDPVSIHTLTAAGHQLLHDIGKKQGMSSVIRGLPGIRPEYKAQLKKAFNNPENFFKHADQDPDKLQDFNPEMTEIFLLDAVLMYEKLTAHSPPFFGTFRMWMFANSPHLMERKYREQVLKWIEVSGADITQISKVEFFEHFVPFFMKNGVPNVVPPLA